MRLYLDTEFNGFGGELISLALAADNGGELYIIRSIVPPNLYEPWVIDNVLPNLTIDEYPGRALSDEEFMRQFALFIYRYRGAEIVADWPADIEHFCACMTYLGREDGFKVPGEFTFRLIDRMGDYNSALPHNALSDARALRTYCKDWNK